MLFPRIQIVDQLKDFEHKAPSLPLNTVVATSRYLFEIIFVLEENGDRIIHDLRNQLTHILERRLDELFVQASKNYKELPTHASLEIIASAIAEMDRILMAAMNSTSIAKHLREQKEAVMAERPDLQGKLEERPTRRLRRVREKVQGNSAADATMAIHTLETLEDPTLDALESQTNRSLEAIDALEELEEGGVRNNLRQRVLTAFSPRIQVFFERKMSELDSLPILAEVHEIGSWLTDVDAIILSAKKIGDSENKHKQWEEMKKKALEERVERILKEFKSHETDTVVEILRLLRPHLNDIKLATKWETALTQIKQRQSFVTKPK